MSTAARTEPLPALGHARPRLRLPATWGLWLAALACLLVLVAWPLAEIVLESLQNDAGPTLANFQTVLSNRRMLMALLNSVELGFACATLSVLVGAPLAWLVSQTDLPFRGVVRLSVLAAFVTPGFVNALAWILLAGPNAGLLNKAWMAVTGAETGLVNIFSLTGLVIVSFSTVYPLAFLLIYNAVQAIDSEVEEAARVGGAGRIRILLTITLPLTRPALVSAFILTFLESIVLYGAPAVIGVPARVYVVTTQLATFFEYPPRLGQASALSLVLLAMTFSLLAMQRWVLSGRSFSTIRGKGGRRRLVRLAAWRWPLAALVLILLALTVLLPYWVIIETSFLGQAFRGLTWHNLTFGNFTTVLGGSYAAGPLSIKNSLITGTLAATAAIVIGTVIAYLVERRLVPWRGALAFLATAPAVIPGMVLAVGLFAAYSGGPIALYGTLWILALAYLSKFLPFAYLTTATAISNVYEDLESAARVLGAGRVRILREITGPLIRQSLLAGWIMVFVPSLKELSTSILLFNSRTTVIATAIMDAYMLPSWETVAALSTILLLINAAVILVGYRVFGGNVLGQSN